MAYVNARHGSELQHSDPDEDSGYATFFRESGAPDLDTIMEEDFMPLPNDSHLRRGSNNAVISPADSHAWDQPFAGALTAQIVPVDPASDHFMERSHSMAQQEAYHQGQQPQNRLTSHQTAGWAVEQQQQHQMQYGPSVSLRYEQPPPPYERQQSYIQHPHPPNQHREMGHSSIGPAPPSAYGPQPEQQMFNPATHLQTPVSPHGAPIWATSLPERTVSPEPQRVRDLRRTYSSVDAQRQSGVRKKNGRIEIPIDRTVTTIDSMIENEVNDEKIKELKQQKRLLRNREAALASRQRKKKHTEELENKEKHWSHSMTEAHERLQHVSNQNQTLLSRCTMLQGQLHQAHVQLQQAQHELQVVEEDKRTTAQKHEEDMSALRKKLQLVEESSAMAQNPDSVGYHQPNAAMVCFDMDAAHPWDNFIDVPQMVDDATDLFSVSSPQRDKTPVAVAAPPPSSLPETSDSSAEDQAPPGLVLFLLLCGAWVAANPADPQAVQMLAFPEEVKQAAPALLNSLLSAPGPPIHRGNSRDRHVSLFTRSCTLSRNRLNPQSGSAGGTGSGNKIEAMHFELTSPSRAQQAADAFTLMNSQFSSMSHMTTSPFSDLGQVSAEDVKVDVRPNLAGPVSYVHDEASSSSGGGGAEVVLDASASGSGGTATTAATADIDNRSLLWSQIPSDVIDEFKSMVKDGDDPEDLLGRIPMLRTLSNSRRHRHLPIQQRKQQQQQQSSQEPSQQQPQRLVDLDPDADDDDDETQMKHQLQAMLQQHSSQMLDGSEQTADDDMFV